MKSFLNIKKDDAIESVTMFREDELGEDIIQTEFLPLIATGDDPGELGLEVGRAKKGSLTVVKTGYHRYALRMRMFRHTTDTASTPTPIHTTIHGRIYRNNRHTRVVFEFPRNAAFSDIADMLDDETYEMRMALEKGA